ncbi:MAG: HAMP domain-containing protein, partial [Hyphomicrobiales bacterium]|nr:HAMP domain-containing protein [Hyphomicrobiales bacterium]
MRAGFSQYLAQAELDRFDGLAEALVASYDPQQPGWPELTANREAWHRIVRRSLQPGPGMAPRPPENAPLAEGIRPGPPPPRPGDPLQFGVRLSLLDAKGDRIAGAPPRGGVLAKRALVLSGSGDETLTIGWIALAAASTGPSSADRVFLEGQFRTLALTAVLALALSAAAAYLLARRFLGPVQVLAQGAKSLAAGDFSTRIESSRRDELGALYHNFNELAESLEAAERAERQWVSDTAHELKTPLSILRAEIEALQDGIRISDAKTLDELHGSVMRLSRLVGDLNVLAQGREGALAENRHIEDVGEIVDEAVESARPRIEGSGLTLSADLEPNLFGRCDSLRIRQLVDNLLENARRYTSAPGRIVVSVRSKVEWIEIAIEDSAPAPPFDKIPHLFDRF